MIDDMLALVAPHHCYGCGFGGSLLCDNCKYDIIAEPFWHCIACGKTIASANGICSSCKVFYQRSWCVADRRDALQKLIDGFKFSNARAAYRPLADLLHERLPVLPKDTVVMPVPTVSSHIRQRGYDHMLLIARRFARMRGLQTSVVLQRVTSTRQRDAGRALRIAQAKAAFRCKGQLDPSVTYLLVDDVMTTGATMKYAAKALRDAGAEKVWVASIGRQPLD